MREVLVAVHLTAAAAWVGGMICFVALFMPWVREQDDASRREQLRAFGHRFRRYAWVCLAVIAVTGPVLVWMRWGGLPSLTTVPGRLLLAKVSLFALAIALNRCDSGRVSRTTARWTGRLSLGVGVAALLVATWLVRR
jgi:putative copper export protein